MSVTCSYQDVDMVCRRLNLAYKSYTPLHTYTVLISKTKTNSEDSMCFNVILIPNSKISMRFNQLLTSQEMEIFHPYGHRSPPCFMYVFPATMALPPTPSVKLHPVERTFDSLTFSYMFQVSSPFCSLPMNYITASLNSFGLRLSVW